MIYEKQPEMLFNLFVAALSVFEVSDIFLTSVVGALLCFVGHFFSHNFERYSIQYPAVLFMVTGTILVFSATILITLMVHFKTI